MELKTRMDGQVAVITGGAQGIGASTGRIMAELGATVVLADVNEDGANATAEAINADGGTAVGVRYDAFDKDAVRGLITDVAGRFGHLDILHNNVGGSWPDRDLQVLDIDDDTWLKIFDWNMHTTHWATTAVLPIMLEQGKGSIVNTITGGAQVGMSIQVAYGSAKGAVSSYTRYVAVQYGRRGIRCNAVNPGLILTPHAVEVMSEDFKRSLFDQITTVRAGVPDDIGYAVAFLASDAAGYINGEAITVAGGGPRSSHDAEALRVGAYGPSVPAPPADLILPDLH
ncbi:SDR family NAD(P)-dependent oxidoreductase [Jatrophihabitans endophyticus]|uniref:SDR family NAD(P)-dependent oxidoreductase n=1 Tax=Jatrophihabitans endophyticus TaxID=1206085 RepID=UPI0019DD101C|nr:SDR family NAD(P)-dependent oxidoreductase [Jatrophihabitans endophyticus]MBE7189649.1 SDR family oxidoreductase [Jatrophihabitans endophyticus]